MFENNLLLDNPLWIVDVGASGGIDPKWSQFTSSYKAILFEPDPREYRLLKAKSDKNLVFINSALSDESKEVDFHLCKKQQVSSVYLPNIEFLKNFPNVERFEVTKSINLTADSLSEQLRKNQINEIDFIKVDTQGYELPILKGSIDYLDSVVGLEVEVEFAQLYLDQPLFSEVDSYIRSKCFELFDIKRYYWKRKGSEITSCQKGQLIFGDALYLKSPEYILSMKNLTQEKIIRSICIYLVYGYLDLAQSLASKANDKGMLEKSVYTALLLSFSRYEKRNLLPVFRGKDKVKGFFEMITKRLGSGWNSGSDTTLGN